MASDQISDPEPGPEVRRSSRLAAYGPRILLALVVLLVLMQLVPYRVKNHPVVAEPNWDSPQTRELAVRACYDCHSNQTKRIWFEQVAPLSWWITNHVDEGRGALNFSECGSGERDEAAETVEEGSMPPGFYTWFGLHRDAKLSAEERRTLAEGLDATARRGCA